MQSQATVQATVTAHAHALGGINQHGAPANLTLKVDGLLPHWSVAHCGQALAWTSGGSCRYACNVQVVMFQVASGLGLGLDSWDKGVCRVACVTLFGLRLTRYCAHSHRAVTDGKRRHAHQADNVKPTRHCTCSLAAGTQCVLLYTYTLCTACHTASCRLGPCWRAAVQQYTHTVAAAATAVQQYSNTTMSTATAVWQYGSTHTLAMAAASSSSCMRVPRACTQPVHQTANQGQGGVRQGQIHFTHLLECIDQLHFQLG